MGIFRQPPHPFQGGRQPLEGRRLTPEGAAASADSPASFQWVSVVIPREESVAYRPQRRFVPIVAAVEETFPFTGAGKLQSAYLSIVGAWQQPWVMPQAGKKLTQQRITLPDNPGSFEPFLATLELEESPAYRPHTLKRLLAQEQAAQVDNPPMGLRPWLDSILRQWEIDWPSQTVRHVIQETAEQVDNPPLGLKPWLDTILRQWRIDWPAQNVRHLIQEFVAQVDDPPFSGRDLRSTILQAWQPAPPQPQTGRLFVQEETPAPVNEPPYGLKPWLNTVLDTWKTTWGTQQRPKIIPEFVAAVVDNPTSFQWYSVVLRLGESPAYRPVRNLLVQEAAPAQVDEPPYGLRPWLNTVLKSWEVTWTSQARPPQVQPFVEPQVDEPPYGLRPWLNTVLKSWDVKWTSQARPPQVQPFVPAQVDEPPYGIRPWLTTVRRAWEPPPPQPQRRPPREVFPLEEPPGFGWTAVEVKWPESNAFWMVRRFVVQPFIEPPVNDPPFGLKPWLNTVLNSWLVTWRAQSRPPQVQPFIEPPVDNPPFGLKPWIPTTLKAWEVTWESQARPPLVPIPEQVDEPPYGLRPWLNTILKSWEVVWTSQARPPQVQPFIEPPVNDPPFGIRPWLLAVRSAWEPGPPDPWKLPDRVVQEGVAVPTVDDDDDDRIRKWEQWTPWLSAAEKEDLQRQLDAINADDAEIMMLVKGLAPMLYRLKRKKKRTLH